jgi:hypothetical protein
MTGNERRTTFAKKNARRKLGQERSEEKSIHLSGGGVPCLAVDLLLTLAGSRNSQNYDPYIPGESS